jgi:hypothetical protein
MYEGQVNLQAVSMSNFETLKSAFFQTQDSKSIFEIISAYTKNRYGTGIDLKRNINLVRLFYGEGTQTPSLSQVV